MNRSRGSRATLQWTIKPRDSVIAAVSQQEMHMRVRIIATALMLTVLVSVSFPQQTMTDTDSQDLKPNRLFVGQSLDLVKSILTKREIEFAEGGFAFAKGDPDRANLIVIIDKNHTYACVHYSKSQSKVTGLQMVFFPSRSQHGKANESWLSATELQLNNDRTYAVLFSPPSTDDELRKFEENRPKPQLPMFGK
ncbi:MAG TPA: hypothetical protein VMM56_07165 [Planctomycetaceae bacterium]|nr:hypothetical protein [Planctomycetaceae bacterium]